MLFWLPRVAEAANPSFLSINVGVGLLGRALLTGLYQLSRAIAQDYRPLDPSKTPSWCSRPTKRASSCRAMIADNREAMRLNLDQIVGACRNPIDARRYADILVVFNCTLNKLSSRNRRSDAACCWRTSPPA